MEQKHLPERSLMEGGRRMEMHDTGERNEAKEKKKEVVNPNVIQLQAVANGNKNRSSLFLPLIQPSQIKVKMS